MHILSLRQNMVSPTAQNKSNEIFQFLIAFLTIVLPKKAYIHTMTMEKPCSTKLLKNVIGFSEQKIKMILQRQPKYTNNIFTERRITAR